MAILCLAKISYPQFTVTPTASNNNVCLGNSATLSAIATPVGYTVTTIPTNASPAAGTDMLAEFGAIGATPLSIGNLDDGRWDNITLPFSFRAYGTIFNSLNICTNGWVGLGSTNSTTTGLNVTIPNSGTPNNVIHAITSDLTFGGGPTNLSSLEYFQEGFPPNRKFIIDFANLKFVSGAGSANIQVILYETSNVIEIHTTTCTNTNVLKTQGIENSTGTVASAAPGRNNIANWNISAGSSSYRFTPDNISYTWSPGATLNSTSGGTVIATPTSNTTYTVTALNTVNSQSATNTITVNVNPASYTLAAIAGGPQICQNISVTPGGTYYRDGSCELIATLAPAGASPLTNSVNTCTQRDTGATKRGTTQLYVARKYDIEPILNPGTATANITLYYLQQEFTNYNMKAADSGQYFLPTGPSDAPGISNLRLHQFHGTGSNPSNYTGTQSVFSTANAGFTVTWNATRSWWEVTVPVSGFSGFYLTSVKLGALPVSMEYFKGSQNGRNNILNWKAICTTTDAIFSIERSANALNFSPINNIIATRLRCEQPFNFIDEHTLNGNNYYRINMIDIDGRSKYSNIVLLSQKLRSLELISLQPNIITQGNATLKVNAMESKMMTLLIRDIYGRKIQKTLIPLQAGLNSISVTTNVLSAGVYQLTGYTNDEAAQTLQFIKK